jgi:hypothetical protein
VLDLANIRLVTVSSPEYLPGTRVMLHTFRQTNPWFCGETLVLHTRLRDHEVDLLEREFANLACRLPSPQLRIAIDLLVSSFPALDSRRDRFLSLECLLLDGDAPLLFVDSDVLISGDLAGLFAPGTAVVACADATMLRGRERDRHTFAEVDRSADADTARPSFNSGMLALGAPAALRAKTAAMFDLLTPARWQWLASDHTDQAVWNALFADDVELADCGYNFMVGHAPLYQQMPDNLRALHFNGRHKPWLPASQLRAASHGQVVQDCYARWLAAWRMVIAHGQS